MQRLRGKNFPGRGLLRLRWAPVASRGCSRPGVGPLKLPGSDELSGKSGKRSCSPSACFLCAGEPPKSAKPHLLPPFLAPTPHPELTEGSRAAAPRGRGDEGQRMPWLIRRCSWLKGTKSSCKLIWFLFTSPRDASSLRRRRVHGAGARGAPGVGVPAQKYILLNIP